MDIRRLQHLRRAAEAGSISAAAASLGISQPALTKSIRILETELGVPLLERRARGVAPTAFGEALLRRAAPVGLLLADALREIAELRGGAPTEAAIGAGPTWLREKLPEAVAATIAALPGVRIRLQGGYDEALLRALRAGTLDAVVAELPPAEDVADLALLPLGEDDFVVGCRRGHPLARGQVAPERLLGFPWVLPPRPSRARARLGALFVARGLVPPEPALETESTDMLLRVVAGSDALCFSVRSALEAPDAAGLTTIRVPALAATRRTGIMLRRDGWLPPVARDVLSRLAASCGVAMPDGYGVRPKS
jgi:LysR family transcriptional regulator of gallate degradation